MPKKLSPDNVAAVIRARKILKANEFDRNTDIKTLCAAAGISRKTGYQRARKMMQGAESKEEPSELKQLRADNEDLKQQLDDVRFENEGRKVAWEIHEVDKLLAEKKSITVKRKGKRR
jgi:AraC-like DNA-binding protein